MLFIALTLWLGKLEQADWLCESQKPVLCSDTRSGALTSLLTLVSIISA